LDFFSLSITTFFGSDGFQPERTFYEGKDDGAWSLGRVFSIATYKSQKIGEVSIFVTAKIYILHLKCFKINFKIDLTFVKGTFWLKTMRSLFFTFLIFTKRNKTTLSKL